MRLLLLRRSSLTCGLAVLFWSSGAQAEVFAPDNTPFDRDLDGEPDYVRVVGDFDGNAEASFDDLQAAVNALTDPDSEKLIEVLGGPYGPPRSSTLTAMLVLPSRTRLRCQEGVAFRGCGEQELRTKLQPTRLITNDVVVDPITRLTEGPATSGSDIHIENCSMSYDLDEYTTEGWFRRNHFGIYLDRVAGFSISGVTVDNTVHTCFYNRSSSDGLLSDNVAGAGCGSAKDTSPFAKKFHGFYAFASEGVDFERVSYTNNVSLGARGNGFHTRAQFTCQGGSSDGAACEIGEDQCTGGGACAEAWVREVAFIGNRASGSQDGCFGLLSLRDSALVWNECEKASRGFVIGAGVDDKGQCSSSEPSDDAVCGLGISLNTVRQVEGNGVRFAGNVEQVMFAGNDVYGVGMAASSGGDQAFVRLSGRWDWISILNNFFATGFGEKADGVYASANSAPNERAMQQFTVSGNTFVGVGPFLGNASVSMVDVDVPLANPVIRDNAFLATASGTGKPSQACIRFRGQPVENALVTGNDCRAINREIPRTVENTADVAEAHAPESHVVMDGVPKLDASPSCQEGARWEVRHGGETPVLLACSGGAWLPEALP